MFKSPVEAVSYPTALSQIAMGKHDFPNLQSNSLKSLLVDIQSLIAMLH